MKYLLLIICSIFAFLGGYFLAPKSADKKSQEVIVQEKMKSSDSEDTPYEYGGLEEAEKDLSKSRSSKNKISEKERKLKMQEHFKYLLKRLPFSFANKHFDKRRREVDKASFEIFNKPPSKDFEAVKEYQKEAFDSIQPQISKDPYYVGKGTLNYRGFQIPYAIALSFKNPWKGNQTGKLDGPDDLDFMISLIFDTRSVGFGGERYVINSGSGIYDVILHRGKTFLKTYVYFNQKNSVFDDALYFLLEAPLGEELTTSLQLFDTSINKWIMLSDQVNLKPVAEEAYRKVRESAYVTPDETP